MGFFAPANADAALAALDMMDFEVYRFDTDSRYEVVKTNKYGTTALTTVVYQDGASVEPVNNWGILSYNNEKECFVAVELESNFVSEEQVLEIAKSIEF